MAILAPTTLPELIDAVRSSPRVIPVGASTKPAMSRVGAEYARIATTRMTGIVEYEPSEFTFTARAGTPLREIVQTLAGQGQYLPFDPVLVHAGSTLGGAVAAGLSGSGRFRFGGLRDFILGIRFVDGEGRVLRMGGKVVKNAAGFDFPKFFVGSAGRFGILAELSFKVFPRPAATRTLRLEAEDFAAKVKLFAALARGRWEIDALDAPLQEPAVYARIGGPPAALEPLVAEILGHWRGQSLSTGEADFFWQTVGEFRWAHSSGSLAKFVLVPAAVAEFGQRLRSRRDVRAWIAAAGNVAYVSVPAAADWPELAMPGVALRGDGPLWLGPQPRSDVMQAVKTALDPNGRFPALDERTLCAPAAEEGVKSPG